MSCAWILPKPFPTLVPGRIFFHKTCHWGQKDWGPLLYRALRIHHLEAVGQLDLEVDHCQSSWYRWSGKGVPLSQVVGEHDIYPSLGLRHQPLSPWCTWCGLPWWRPMKGRVAKKHQVLSRCWRFDATSAGVEHIPKLHHIRMGTSWEGHGMNKIEPHGDPSTVVHLWANCRHIWVAAFRVQPVKLR